MCTCTIDTTLLISSPTLQDVIFGKDGLPLIAGVVTFYRQADMTTFKNVYYQTGSAPPFQYIALPNPLVLSDAGSFQDVNGNDVIPFFYPALDDCVFTGCDPNTPDSYYITVYNADGQFQFDRKDFPFNSGEPTPVTTIATLENYLLNNRFWRNIGQSQSGNPTYNAATLTQYTRDEYNNSGTYYTARLAPSQHDGFSMPDFRYIRNANTSVTESIAFNIFAEQLAPPIIEGDIQPEYYITHNCTADSSGATLKIYQFPISLHQATLANQNVTFTIQGKSTSGSASITVNLYQFCGTGVASPAPVPLGDGVITLGNSWQKYELFGTFPSNNNISLSGTNDDAFYLQIGMPVGSGTAAICNLSFCLPSLYLSDGLDNLPTNSFQTYDQIDSIIAAPRTGDVKVSMNDFSPWGWVPMTGGTIASVNTTTTVSAPASNLGIAYQGTDAWPLYSLLWNKFVSLTNGTSNPLAQLYNAAGTAIAYGSNAWSDWNALNQLSLSPMIGRVLMGTVPATALPLLYKNTITASQLTTPFTAATSTSGILFTSTQAMAFGEVVQVASGGGTLPTELSASTNYYAVPVTTTTFYLATSLANAQAAVVILGSNLGSGTINVISFSLVLTVSVTPNALNLFRGQIVTFTNTGGTLPGGLAINTLYYAVPCAAGTFCVASSFANAMSGTLIAYSSAGTGTTTATITFPGALEGEFAHSQYGAEVGTHGHTPNGTQSGLNFVVTNAGASLGGTGTGATPLSTTGTTGQGVAANITQPSVQMNFLIKL